MTTDLPRAVSPLATRKSNAGHKCPGLDFIGYRKFPLSIRGMCVRARLGIICLQKHQVILGTARDAKQKYKNSGTMLPAVGREVNVVNAICWDFEN